MARLRDRARERLTRQFQLIERRFPGFGRYVAFIRADRARLIRLPIALLFILGGLLAVLPFLGLWMLPVGLMLLAVDLPFLQGPVSAAVIRLRRRFGHWLRRPRA
jgi:hypothetical protein